MSNLHQIEWRGSAIDYGHIAALGAKLGTVKYAALIGPMAQLTPAAIIEAAQKAEAIVYTRYYYETLEAVRQHAHLIS